jgi:hypothetical protein
MQNGSQPEVSRFSANPFEIYTSTPSDLFFLSCDPFCTIYWVYEIGIMLVTETAFEAHDINPNSIWGLCYSRYCNVLGLWVLCSNSKNDQSESFIMIYPVFWLDDFRCTITVLAVTKPPSMIFKHFKSSNQNNQNTEYIIRGVLIILSRMSTISNVCRKSYINVK